VIAAEIWWMTRKVNVLQIVSIWFLDSIMHKRVPVADKLATLHQKGYCYPNILI
jgi:hypothetical protein